jgi:hypothetical protein
VQLAVGRLGLLGVADDVELLVVADAALAACDVEPAVVEALRIEAFVPRRRLDDDVRAVW